MSLIKKILMIKEKQPVTEESLKQLELQAREAELKAAGWTFKEIYVDL